MKVIRHYYIYDKLCWPGSYELTAHLQKTLAATRAFEDSNSADYIAGDIVKCTWKILIVPFLSQEELREKELVLREIWA